MADDPYDTGKRGCDTSPFKLGVTDAVDFLSTIAENMARKEKHGSKTSYLCLSLA